MLCDDLVYGVAGMRIGEACLEMKKVPDVVEILDRQGLIQTVEGDDFFAAGFGDRFLVRERISGSCTNEKEGDRRYSEEDRDGN